MRVCQLFRHVFVNSTGMKEEAETDEKNISQNHVVALLSGLCQDVSVLDCIFIIIPILFVQGH